MIALALAGGMRGISRGEAARVAVAGLLVVTVYHLALNQGEETTTAGTAAVIIACAPAIALALAVSTGLERFSGRRAAGLALRSSGCWWWSCWAPASSCPHPPTGPLLVLVAAGSFAAYNVMVKPLLRRHSAVAVTAPRAWPGRRPALRRPQRRRATTHRMSGGQWALVIPGHRLHAGRLHRLDARAASRWNLGGRSRSSTACRSARSPSVRSRWGSRSRHGSSPAER